VPEKRHVDLGAVDLDGLIEQLIRREPTQPENRVSPGGGVASSHDALTAVAQLATAIEVPAEAGDLDPEHTFRMASLLLVIRDYVEPLTSPFDDRVYKLQILTEFIGKLHHT
jgi:hypothetical protein